MTVGFQALLDGSMGIRVQHKVKRLARVIRKESPQEFAAMEIALGDDSGITASAISKVMRHHAETLGVEHLAPTDRLVQEFRLRFREDGGSLSDFIDK